MQRCCFVVLLCDSSFYLFFFFKQKTAYEMRISDWSSDVCSSDLEGVFEADVLRIGAARILGAVGAGFDRAVVDPVIGFPARFQRREIDEQFEGRARLAPRLRRAVAGRCGLILSADHRDDPPIRAPRAARDLRLAASGAADRRGA